MRSRNQMSTPDISALTKCLRGSPVETLRQFACRLEADAHGLWRLGVLLDTAEFCIKFRAVYVLAECLRAKIPLPGKIGGDFTKPTFGDWKDVLRDGSIALLGRKDAMIAVPNLLSDQSLNKSISILVSTRNRRAHGATLSAIQALAESERIIKHVIGVARAFQTEEWDFLGEPLEADVKSITTHDGSRWSRPYLRARADGCVTKLFPWLVEEESNEGTHLLIFNRDNQTESKQGSLDYLDYGSGEERDLATECRGAVQDALKRFKLAGYGPNWQSGIIEQHRQFYVGRENELEQLRNFVMSGEGEVQIVTGPPGFGKTALLTKLADGCDTIRQFVTVMDETTTDTDTILKNLRRQVAARADSRGGTTTHDPNENSVCPREVIVIDGLDEAKNLPSLLRGLRSDDALKKARFIFGGHPHVCDLIKNTFGDDGVCELELTGLSLDQTEELAELHELRQLSRHDIEALHAWTHGGPLFLRTVFHDLSNGAISLSDLHSLPKSVEDYWDTLLSRHNPTGVNRNPDSVRHLKRISAAAFQEVLNVWKIEPAERSELSKEFGQSVDRRLRMELSVFLGILAQSPLPLSVLHLKEIVSTTDEQFVPKALKDLGSLVKVDEYAEQVKLCHGSLKSFLLCKHKDATEDATGLLRKWAGNWVADTSGVRAKVFCSVCNQTELSATLNDWAFLELFLRAWGIDEATQLYDSATEGIPTSHLGNERLRDAFCPLPPKLRADMDATIEGQPVSTRGGGRVINERAARLLEREERNRETPIPNTSSEDDEADESANTAYIWNRHQQQDELEARWRHEQLPSAWFGDWTSCEKALSKISAGYSLALDGPPPLEEPPNEEPLRTRIGGFLRHCKRQLSISDPDIPVVAYNSGAFRETPLDLELKERITRRQTPWIERTYRHPASPYARAEAIFREVGQGFIVAPGSSIICYVRCGPGARDTHELVAEDWRDSTRAVRVLIPSRPNQYIEALCLSFDGKTVLVRRYEQGEKFGEWPSRLLLLDTTSGTSAREIPVESNRAFKRLFDATPDLSLLLVEFGGQAALLNSITGAVTELPLLNDIEYNDCGHLSRDGRIVLFRRRRGGYLGFDTIQRKLLRVDCRSDSERDVKFALDPSGRLFVVSGRVCSITEGLWVRDFDKSCDQDCAAFSLDSRILLIATASILRAYDVREGRQIGEYALREPCSSITLSGDGSLALLKTQSDNFLVIDLHQSVAAFSDKAILEEHTAIASDSNDSSAYFWDEREQCIVRCWRQTSGVLTDERVIDAFELSEWMPGKREWESPTPVFKAGNEIWFRVGGNFHFSILNLEQGKTLTGISLLGDSAPPGLIQAIQRNLAPDYERRKRHEPDCSYPEPTFDNGPVVIDANHVAFGIYRKILAVLDVGSRAITHWVSWAEAPTAGMDLKGMCVRGETVYALSSSDELLIWNWRENRDVEVIDTHPDGYQLHEYMGICSAGIVIRLFERKGQSFVSTYEIDNKRVIENRIEIDGLMWGQHFLAITDQPLFLVDLVPGHSDRWIGNQLALVDVSTSRVVSSIFFESNITDLFQLGSSVIGVALDDGAIEAIRIW